MVAAESGWHIWKQQAIPSFTVKIKDENNTKAALGVPDQLRSCHTAKVDGYVLEGHVRAADVEKLLSERPVALGLAVPGMPMDSPGMECPGFPLIATR